MAHHGRLRVVEGRQRLLRRFLRTSFGTGLGIGLGTGLGTICTVVTVSQKDAK